MVLPRHRGFRIVATMLVLTCGEMGVGARGVSAEGAALALVPQLGGVESAPIGRTGPCLDDAQRTAIRSRIEAMRPASA